MFDKNFRLLSLLAVLFAVVFSIVGLFYTEYVNASAKNRASEFIVAEAAAMDNLFFAVRDIYSCECNELGPSDDRSLCNERRAKYQSSALSLQSQNLSTVVASQDIFGDSQFASRRLSIINGLIDDVNNGLALGSSVDTYECGAIERAIRTYEDQAIDLSIQFLPQ